MMQRRLWMAVWLAALAAGTAVAQPAAAPAPARLAETVAEARQRVQAALAEQGFPGIAIAVSVEGETVWSEGFGYADLEHRVPVWPTTKFRIGSISKPLTAAAVAQLVAAGRLDADAPVQRYVPTFPEKRWPVTTRQLGGHLAGVRHYRGAEFLIRDPYASVTAALDVFKADTLLHEPGTRYAYSSYGWNLLSAVVEGAAGEPFLAYMRNQVFRPLGMHHTVADHPDSLILQRAGFYDYGTDGALVNAPFVNNSYKWAGGGFLSTVEDLLRFGNAHLGDDFLPPEAKALLFTEQTTEAGEGVGYGFGWFVGTDDAGRRQWSHGGGSIGGTSWLGLQPDARLVVVGLVNQSRADLGVVREVYRLFLDALE
ncbi:MAG: serine hydrolase domain-containing protein [Rhodothermales bacterium]|nr:serine hydrolase domain-containing protein [Rhodothermales bacterium]